ncbi:MAG: hypothetical protein ACMXYG_02445 [Candidatus Woesearchaeota archaeon]
MKKKLFNLLFVFCLVIFPVFSQQEFSEIANEMRIPYIDVEGHLRYNEYGNQRIISHNNGNDYLELPSNWPNNIQIMSDNDRLTLRVSGNIQDLPTGIYNIESVDDILEIDSINLRIETISRPIVLEQQEDQTNVILNHAQMLTYNGARILVREETIISFDETFITQDKNNYIIIGDDIKFKGAGISIFKDNFFYLTRDNSENENIISTFTFDNNENLPRTSYDIMKNQAFLVSNGYDLDIDGIYGPITRRMSNDYIANNLDRNINYFIGDNVDIWYDIDGIRHVATITDNEILASRNFASDKIGIETAEQILFTTEDGQSYFTVAGSIGNIRTSSNIQQRNVQQTLDNNNDNLNSDYEFLRSLIGIPYGPKYPQGPNQNVRHLDCVSLVYCFANEHKGVTITGSRGDQIYARHTTHITTINNDNKNMDNIQTGDIVFIGHPYSRGEGGISAYHLGVVGAPIINSDNEIVDYTMIHASGSYGRNRATDFQGEVKEESSMLRYLQQYRDNERRNHMFIGRLNTN